MPMVNFTQNVLSFNKFNFVLKMSYYFIHIQFVIVIHYIQQIVLFIEQFGTSQRHIYNSYITTLTNIFKVFNFPLIQ